VNLHVGQNKQTGTEKSGAAASRHRGSLLLRTPPLRHWPLPPGQAWRAHGSRARVSRGRQRATLRQRARTYPQLDICGRSIAWIGRSDRSAHSTVSARGTRKKGMANVSVRQRTASPRQRLHGKNITRSRHHGWAAGQRGSMALAGGRAAEAPQLLPHARLEGGLSHRYPVAPPLSSISAPRLHIHLSTPLIKTQLPLHAQHRLRHLRAAPYPHRATKVPARALYPACHAATLRLYRQRLPSPPSPPYRRQRNLALHMICVRRRKKRRKRQAGSGRLRHCASCCAILATRRASRSLPCSALLPYHFSPFCAT